MGVHISDKANRLLATSRPGLKDVLPGERAEGAGSHALLPRCSSATELEGWRYLTAPGGPTDQSPSAIRTITLR